MITKPTIYTESFVLDELKLLLQTLKEDKEIIYLWELFEDKNYNKARFSEWVKEYPDNEEINQISFTIKDILESRAVKWAITNKLNSTFTIFHLKNNYNWKDKSEVDNNIKWELNIWWVLEDLSESKPNLTSNN